MFDFVFQIIDDADLVFDEQLLSDNEHHVINRRSPLDSNIDSDVHDLLFDDPAIQDEHWLWDSVKRIRRSIDQLLGTQKPVTKRQRKRHASPKALANPSAKVHAAGKMRQGKKHNPAAGRRAAFRLKRQEDENYDSEDDDGYAEGSGETTTNHDTFNSPTGDDLTNSETCKFDHSSALYHLPACLS